MAKYGLPSPAVYEIFCVSRWFNLFSVLVTPGLNDSSDGFSAILLSDLQLGSHQRTEGLFSTPNKRRSRLVQCARGK